MSKRVHLFLKPPKQLPNAEEAEINIIEVSSKIVKPDTYEKVAKDPIYSAQWKKAIHAELKTLHLKNIWELVDLFADCKAIGSK